MKSPLWFAATVISLAIFMVGLTNSALLLWAATLGVPGVGGGLLIVSLAVPVMGLAFLGVCGLFKPGE